VDDGGARGTGLLHQFHGVLEHAGRLHHRRDSGVQGATLSGEVVLVLDEDDGGAGRIDGG